MTRRPDAAAVLDRLSPPTRAWFTTTFTAPTRVQAEGWPRILDAEHTLMVAPTGSGKTLAAFLACLDRVAALPDDAPPGLRIVYVSPLKALAHDIERNLRAPIVGMQRAAERLGHRMHPLRVDVRTGDTPQRDRQRMARKPGEILVTTPESLYLVLTSKAREVLRTVDVVILDEIHVLAGTKRGVHLALSLERLDALADRPVQRIGLSATQRPLSVAARFLGGDRPVACVDTSEPPRLDLRIVVPVEDMENPPQPDPGPAGDGGDGFDPWEDDPYAADLGPTGVNPPATGSTSPLQSGIWPSIHPQLVDLIRRHRSTILFTNSRLLCERLTQAINEVAGETLVHAHHGSISHQRRGDIEEALKAGRIPGIVATSSLELGIDMGAVDLVILVESPGSAARGLQRIGRAGHQVGATSIGRIFPKYRGDLLEAAVVAQHMAEGTIEATRMPERCLDVLAQQIVAMVSQEDVEVGALFDTVRRAAPYAALPREVFDEVLDMLSGRYPSDAFADLTPSITWDRARDLLTPRRSARLLAVLNGGTIPDRGLYRVKLGQDGPHLGELDEEMVFESRSGDTIVLGASSWRIDEITRDQVHVSPAPGVPGRLPFWRGERPGRPLELGRALGDFLEALAPLDREAMTAHVRDTTELDDLAIRNLVAYVAEQRDTNGSLPTADAITVERFRDELGDWRVCILTPFGSKVHAPWSLALAATLEARTGLEVNTFYSDDGVALRFADADTPPDLDHFLPEPEEVESLVVEQLRHSALFAARFRENAARALLLPRRKAQARTPLWLQRKKAQELLGVAQQFPRFPIVLETYRECLQDVFDLPALTDLLTRVRRREVKVDLVDTRHASPFARSLVFQYIAAYLYDGDAPLAERKAAALTLDRELLRELLGQDQLRDLLDADALDEVEAELQRLVDGRRARHADALHDLLRRLGDLREDEVLARCDGDAAAWLAALEDARRAARVRVAGEPRWIAVEDAGRYRDALGTQLPPGLPGAFLDPVDDPLGGLIARWARTHGPFLPQDVAGRFGLSVGVVEAVLRAAESAGTLVQGELRPGGTRREWVDVEVLRRLKRRSLAKLRAEVEPVAPEALGRFLPAWQGLDREDGGLARLQEVIDQLEGRPIPWSILESEVLRARVSDYLPTMLDQLGALGAIAWRGCGSLGPKDGRVALYRRENLGLLAPPAEVLPERPLHAAILAHLQERGASFLVELQRACGEAEVSEVVSALWDLAWAGHVTNDTFQPLRGLSGPTSSSRRRSRRLPRGRVASAGGRWWALSTSIDAETASPTEKAHARVTALLDRYGVVSREVAKAEPLPGGFSAIYPVLREMEEAGRVRRGWFVDGYGGAQFALPGAVDRLRALADGEGEARILGADDPAQPYGALVPWPPTLVETNRPARVAGARLILVGGHPVLYLGRGGRSLVRFDHVREAPASLRAAVDALRATLDVKALRFDKVDGHVPREAPEVEALLDLGLHKDFKGLLLEPGRRP